VAHELSPVYPTGPAFAFPLENRNFPGLVFGKTSPLPNAFVRYFKTRYIA